MFPLVAERRKPPGWIAKKFAESPDGLRRAATSGSLQFKTLIGPAVRLRAADIPVAGI